MAALSDAIGNERLTRRVAQERETAARSSDSPPFCELTVISRSDLAYGEIGGRKKDGAAPAGQAQGLSLRPPLNRGMGHKQRAVRADPAQDDVPIRAAIQANGRFADSIGV